MGVRVSQIQKSGEAVKRLDRLAPNVAHICRSIWEWIYAKQIAPRDIGGGGALRVLGVKHSKVWGICQTAVPNGTNFGSRLCGFIWEWTQAKSKSPLRGHHILYKSADSSGNRHRLNTIRRSIPQWVLRGHKFKSLGKLSNSWTDWHQIWYTSKAKYNGRRLNTIRPSIFQGTFGGGGLGGHKFKCLLKSAEPIGTKFGTPVQIHLGMDIRQKIAFRDTRGHLGVLGGQTFNILEKLSNGWTNWHQLWFTSEDSSGNGHRLQYKSPYNTPGGIFFYIIGCHKFKCLGKLSNG